MTASVIASILCIAVVLVLFGYIIRDSQLSRRERRIVRARLLGRLRRGGYR